MNERRFQEAYETIEGHYWCTEGGHGKRKLIAHYEFCAGCEHLQGIPEGEYPEFRKPTFYKLRMSTENAFALFLLKGKFGLNLDDQNDKSIGRIERAVKKCQILRKRFSDKTGGFSRIKARKFLSRMRRHRRSSFLFVLDPEAKAEIEAVIPAKIIFRNFKTLGRLEEDIKERISRGEKRTPRTLRELGQKYKLPKDAYEEEETGTIKEIKVSDDIAWIWDQIEREGS